MRNSLTAPGSSHSHWDSRQRYATTKRSHSRDSRSDVSAREREREERERFSLRICSKACGGSSSSSSASGAGGSSGGAPSAGTKKFPAPGSLREARDGGVMERAKDLAREEERRRWENRRVARCVELMVAGSRAAAELGGEMREWRRGVIGGASEGPADELDATPKKK